MRTIYITIVAMFFCLIVLPHDVIIGTKSVITSSVLNEERNYWVATPDDYQNSGQKVYPVIYVLDGQEYFEMTVTTVDFLSGRGFMPKTIVVGIDNGKHRQRDLTPTKDLYSPKGGGADNFFRFLNNELIPLIDDNYRTNQNRTIYGTSLGGLFVMYVLYNHTNRFNNYIAISPSLFHNEGSMFEEAVKFFNKELLSNKFIFLSLANEAFSEMRINFNNTLELFKDKAKAVNLEYSYKYYPNETHETTKLVGLYDGLRFIHDKWFLPFYQRNRGLNGVLEHYELLSSRYGYTINIPENIVNSLGYYKLRQDQFDQAYELFDYNVKNFPNSHNAYDSMAEYYEKIKVYSKAQEYYQLALKMASSKGLDTDRYKKSIERISLLKSND